MIKAEVEVCAVITRSATVKQSSEGESFLSFGITIPVKGRDGSVKQLPVSVTTDGGKGEKGAYVEKRRVKILGTLFIRKKGGNVFYNLRADRGCECVKTTEEDAIEGTMEFRGKIGKKGVLVREDKRGRTYKSFSAFSSEKDGGEVQFTWVRFLYFDPKDGEDFLSANTYIQAKGALQLGVFHDEVSINCRITDVEPWELKRN